VDRYLRLYLEVEDYRNTGSKEHSLILKALKAGNDEEALGALKRHLESSRDLLEEFVSKKENGFSEN
jgi:DNA-binding GntR family transcriptional regulator